MNPQIPKHVKPSQERRRERRAGACAAEEAANAFNLSKSIVAEELVEKHEARNQNETVEAAAAEIVVEEATSEHHCDVCDKSFETLKGLRAHIGRKHKVPGSPIPQTDGISDMIPDKATFCKIYQESHEDTKTSEDLSFHIMNNHEVKHVLEAYGHEWAEKRSYCIRRGSPFHGMFPH